MLRFHIAYLNDPDQNAVRSAVLYVVMPEFERIIGDLCAPHRHWLAPRAGKIGNNAYWDGVKV